MLAEAIKPEQIPDENMSSTEVYFGGPSKARPEQVKSSLRPTWLETAGGETPATTAAYIIPEGSENLRLIVDPAKVPGIFPKSRLDRSIEQDLAVEIDEKSLLPLSLLKPDEGSIIQPEYASANVWTDPDETFTPADEVINAALYGPPGAQKEYTNVSQWVSMRIHGKERYIHDPALPGYLGALIAREVAEPTDETEIYLKDLSPRRPSEVLIRTEEFNLAEEITQEYPTSDLDEAIKQDRQKFTSKLARLGSFVVEKIVPPARQIDDHLVYH